MSAVVINAGLVHYEAFGRGSPILFIHGWLGSWRYWMQSMESLAVEHRVYALDLWGFGDSDKSEKRFDIEHYVALITNFIEELGMINPVLVGHSLGAAIAIEYASRNTEAIKKVVAVSLPLSPNAIDRRLENYNSPSLLGKVFRWNPIPSKEVEQEVARAAEKVIPLTLESFSHLQLAEKLTNLGCSVLLVHGEKDDVIDPSTVEEVNGTLAHIRHIALSASRHFPMLDESGKFNRLLKDFSDKSATLESLELKDEWRRRTR